MTVLFSPGAGEIFAELPELVRRRAARSILLLTSHPQMYPVRQCGLMRERRYFRAYQTVFYYSVRAREIRSEAILPGRMRLA